MRQLVALAAVVALSACAQQADLKPAAGARMPAVPYGAVQQPTTEELLEPDTLAAPERSVELRRRSEEREDDPFDLPPE
jgi:hypothetical protein